MPRAKNSAAVAFAATALFAAAAAETNLVVTVTATRLDALAQDVMRVPADVSVIDREAIGRSRAASLPDLLRERGNVSVRTSNGKGDSGELAMRGFGENSGLRVLVVVDGQKLNRSDMGLLDWQQIPLDDIERIEVLRGGQGVQYGNHALSGVIRITTRKGGDTKTKLSASGGSHGFQDYGVSRSGSLDVLRYNAGLRYQRDEGWRDNALSWGRNAYAALGCDLTEEDALTFRFTGAETYLQLPGPLTYEQYKAHPRRSANAGGEDTQTGSGLFTALYEAERGWGRMDVNAGLNLRDNDWRLSGRTGTNRQRGATLSPKILFGDDDAFAVCGGIDLLCDTLDFHGEDNAAVNRAELERLTAGPFATVKKRASDALTFSAGVRYERAQTDARNVQYNKEDMKPFLPNPWTDGPGIPNPNYPARPVAAASYDGAFRKQGWSCEAAALWEVSDALSLWARYSRVYRYPALDESASYQGYPLADPLNERLDPETGDNFELGAKARAGGWRASATAFCLLMDGEIAYDDTRRLNLNIGDTGRWGSDLELAYERERFGAACMAELVAATFRGGPDNGRDVPLVPAAHGSVALWVEPLANLRLTGDCAWNTGQAQGGDFSGRQRRIAGCGLFGLRADWKYRDTLGLFVKAENLFDTAYAGSAYNGGWYPGCGRAFYGGVTLEF